MPKLPAYNTLPGRALALLLIGQRVSHRDFQNHSASYRLSHYIYVLRGLGWPISDHWEEGKTKDSTGRNAKYKRYLIEHQELQNLKATFGERLSGYIEAVKIFESRTPTGK